MAQKTGLTDMQQQTQEFGNALIPEEGARAQTFQQLSLDALSAELLLLLLPLAGDAIGQESDLLCPRQAHERTSAQFAFPAVDLYARSFDGEIVLRAVMHVVAVSALITHAFPYIISLAYENKTKGEQVQTRRQMRQ